MTQSELLKSIRQYFWQLDFTEVEISYLNTSLPLEPNLYPFKTTWTHRHRDYYLPCSPEFALKEYLAKEKKNCFAISHCFRDLEDEGPDHSPEFLMLEWYEIGKNYHDLMLSTQKFVNNFIDIDFEEFVLPQNLPKNEPDFNQYFLNEIEPELSKNKGVFVTGYPAFLSPLAKIKDDSNSEATNFLERNHPSGVRTKGVSTTKISLPSDRISERFELYINGLEIANGCSENTNSADILASFDKERQYRLAHHLPCNPSYNNFALLSAKMLPTAGIGLGLNRFLKTINHVSRKKNQSSSDLKRNY